MDITECIVPDVEDVAALDDELMHYGTLMESGRYPWGSGEHPYQRLKDFHTSYMRLKTDGYTNDQIAEQFGIATNVLKARVALYTDLDKRKNIAACCQLADEGLNNVAIAKKLGISEGAVRNYLKKSQEARTTSVVNVMDAIRAELADGGCVQVGKGTEARMNINKTKLDAAIINLVDEGNYVLYSDIRAKMGGSGSYSTLKVLAPAGMTKKEIYENPDMIKIMNYRSEEGNGSDELKKIEPPKNISSERIVVRYADDDTNGLGDGKSGADRDGLIELRRGVEDLNLGRAHYAQVRIAIDGQAYAKGMAVYADDLPDGVDIRINSNRKRGTPLYSDDPDAKTVLKPQNRDKKTGEIDEENPFSAATKDDSTLRMVQQHYIGADGKEHLSALNIVNEEGDWERWSRNLPSQFLSKQSPELAKQQLNLDSAYRKNEYEELLQITNPTLKREMLMTFADECDSAAVVLKAASLPRQQQHVILPVPELKENEIYAPNYRDGEQVALVRYPHGGTFEIPVLTVNNRNKTAKNMIGSDSRDAVGIHPKAASQLSGADFDGDSVAVIPMSSSNISHRDPLPGLANFDTKAEYSTTEADRKSGAVKIISTQQQSDTEMGKITNLITDMSLTGRATTDELERAVRHSMVIIDAKKHKLDYTRSFEDNGIAELKKKYQLRIDPETGKKTTGAGTLISRASSQVDAPKRRTYAKTDPETGKAIYTETGEMERKWETKVDKETGEMVYIDKGLKVAQKPIARMRLTDDAYTLTSGGSKKNPGTQMEAIYAEYANGMKAMANRARKEALFTEDIPISPTAKQTFASEVAHLKVEVNNAKKNAPLEKKAEMLAQKYVQTLKASEHLSKEEESKQLDKALKRARKAVGAERYEIHLSDRDWEAIQSGAVPKTTQREIFRFVNSDELMKRAMPKEKKTPSASVIAAMKSMLARGYTSEEVASRFDISTTTLHKYVEGS